MDRCRICLKPAETRNIALYVSGSEGLDLCHACEMQLVEFVRGKMREYAEIVRAGYVQVAHNKEA